MTHVTELKDHEFFQWLRNQLEKKEPAYGRLLERNQLWEAIYEILFLEQQLTVEEIERFFIPFGQSGFLTPRQKFELMLFVLEKDYGNSVLWMEAENPVQEITGQDVEEIYLQWLAEERLYLSEEEKKEFFIQSLTDRLGFGILEVLKRTMPDGILMGELCPSQGEEAEEQRIAVYNRGKVTHLPFLALENKEELIRIIKYVVAMENRGELTALEPIWDFVREDGTCITAVRPPAGKGWGIRILYGAAGKEGKGWNI